MGFPCFVNTSKICPLPTTNPDDPQKAGLNQELSFWYYLTEMKDIMVSEIVEVLGGES